MTGPMTALFQFAQENLTMKYLYNDREYHAALHNAEKRLEQFREALAPEEFSHLEALLEEYSLFHYTETEAYFQAGFALAMELDRQL